MILALKFHAKIKEFFSPRIFYPIRSVISSGILLHSAWWRVANDNPNDIFETMDDVLYLAISEFP